MYRKLSLQKRLILVVSTVTIILISAIFLFDSLLLRISVQEAYMGQVKGMTIAINGRYEESHSIEDVQQIFDYIQYKNENVLELNLFGLDGTVLASTDRDRIGSKASEKTKMEITKDQSLASLIQEDADGIPKVRLMQPLKEDGETIGAIQLWLNVSYEEGIVQQRTHSIIIFGLLIGTILLVLLWFILRKMLIVPLMTLRKGALAVKNGDEYIELQMHASPEINEVADAFNQMVENLEERQKRLVESEKLVALGNLVAGVSHEINTPVGIGVTAVTHLGQKTNDFQKLYSDNAMKRSDLESYLSTVTETVDIIRTNLHRASELVKSFKQVAVDQANEVRRKFNVKEYIQEVIVSLRPSFKKTKLEVKLSGNAQLEIYSNPGALSQVITNLVMNSIKHAFNENQEGTIMINVKRTNGNVMITYADNGKGMPPEVSQRIFEPFFTTKRGVGGTGLGMHIVYNLVTQSMGGSIVCESREGEGTTFIIEVPINEGENDAEQHIA